MAITRIQDFTSRADPGLGTTPTPGAREPGKASFGDLVNEFARDVNDLQFQSGHAVEMLATGKAADVHQVMIAAQKAGIALDLMLEVRNRVLEGYQELIRMQV
jgi:flagellar hook-basal body complex protein FliE